jgi:Ca2+-transporting ATPase
MLGFTILMPVHLLWINLITDTLPALALGMEAAESDVMRRPPRNADEGIFAGGMFKKIAFQGAAVTLITLAAYFIGHRIESGLWEIAASSDGMTMAFLTLSMTEIFHAFNMRSLSGSIFFIDTQNRYLWLAMLASLAFTAAVIYVPFLHAAFGFAHISFKEYAAAVALALTIIPIVEIEKAVGRRRDAAK